MKTHFAFFFLFTCAVCTACLATSIVFPAFDTPIVIGDLIVAHHTNGDRIIGLDKNMRSVRWTLAVKSNVHQICAVDSNRIIAFHGNIISVIDFQRGIVLKTFDSTGFVVGCSTRNDLLSHTNHGTILCQSLETGRTLWTSQQYEDPKSNADAELIDDFIFLSISPRDITSYLEGENAHVTMTGANMIACLSAKDGHTLWKEKVPLSRAGFGVTSHVASGQNGLLCATDDALRLIDKKSGDILRKWNLDRDLDGAEFWGSDRIVVCLGGIGATKRIIQVRNLSNFDLISEFMVEANECSSIYVVGDVVILDSLYRIIGVDLNKGAVIWKKGQRQYKVHDGLLYYGEKRENNRILGVLDPKTGNDTILYREKIEE